MTTEEKIKALGEELRTFRKSIIDEKSLIGFNMAVAICNKYLGENGNEENEKHYLMLSVSPISGNEKLICTNCHTEFEEKYFRLSVGEAQYCPICGFKVEDSIDGWHQVEKENK